MHLTVTQNIIALNLTVTYAGTTVELQPSIVTSSGEETDPVFQAWLATNPLNGFLTEETDPVFQAWIATNPLSNKADLVDGKVPAEQLPSVGDYIYFKNLGRIGVAGINVWSSADVNFGFANTSVSSGVIGINETTLVQNLPELFVAPFKMRIKEILLTGINNTVFNFGFQLNIQKWNRQTQTNQATILNQAPISQLNPSVYYKLIDANLTNGLQNVIIEKRESVHLIWKSQTASMSIIAPSIFIIYEKIN
jgi:hypothetical protein